MKIDTSMTTAPVRRRLEAERDPLVKRNLKAVFDHMEAELRGDLEGIMATLVAEPRYHIYNVVDAAGNVANAEIKGGGSTRTMYADAIKAQTSQLQEYHISMIVADAAGVANDGFLKVPWAGSSLASMGYDADPDAAYLYQGRLCSFWPIREDGLIIGEDIYFDVNGFKGILERKL